MLYRKYVFYSVVFLTILNVCQLVESKSDLVGKQAPDFTAKMVDPDGTVCDFSLQACKGRLLVLYFYPMDNTPGCTKQAKKFREDIKKLESKGITVIGISMDSIKSHQKFQKKHKLPFSLVSDSRWGKNISKLYGAAGFLYSKRKTFLIDKKGIVIKVFDKVNIQHQTDDILKAFHLI